MLAGLGVLGGAGLEEDGEGPVGVGVRADRRGTSSCLKLLARRWLEAAVPITSSTKLVTPFTKSSTNDIRYFEDLF